MTRRTTRLAAAGLLAVTLPFVGTLDASAVLRTEITRPTVRNVERPTPLGTLRGALRDERRGETDDSTGESAELAALRHDVADAVETAHIALSRAAAALVESMIAADPIVQRFAATELADASIGLDATAAQLRHAISASREHGALRTAEALQAMLDGVTQLQRTVMDALPEPLLHA